MSHQHARIRDDGVLGRPQERVQVCKINIMSRIARLADWTEKLRKNVDKMERTWNGVEDGRKQMEDSPGLSMQYCHIKESGNYVSVHLHQMFFSWRNKEFEWDLFRHMLFVLCVHV